MILDDIFISLQRSNPSEVQRLVQQALDEGVSPSRILDEGLIKGMSVIGRKFKNNEIFVPEVLVAARAMNFGLKILRPALISSNTKAKGTALICTVMGDLHDIGKNMVKMMLEGQGIDVIDLGVDVTPEMVATAIQEHHPDIVCLSALLTTTMINQKVIIDYLVEHNLRSLVKIMVGGAPITPEFAREIQADAYASDAASAADIALTFLD